MGISVCIGKIANSSGRKEFAQEIDVCYWGHPFTLGGSGGG
jgi:hypothetical protein